MKYNIDKNYLIKSFERIFGMAVYCSHGMERTHIDGMIGTVNILLEYILN